MTLVDRVLDEGLATVFERDVGKVDRPWGQAPRDVMEWTREILRQPPSSDPETWMRRHPDGRRWIGYRVGTFIVDRATRASGKTAQAMVATPADVILRLADLK